MLPGFVIERDKEKQKALHGTLIARYKSTAQNKKRYKNS